MDSFFIEVPKHSGERLRRYLNERSLLNRNVILRARDTTLQIPIVRELEVSEAEALSEIAGCKLQLGRGAFDEATKKRTIEEVLGFPPSFEVIGDVAVMLPPEELPAKEVANAILTVHKAIKTVVIPKTPVSGDYRVRSFEWIAGQPIHEVYLREHGSIFKLDIEKVYFSPRLATERARVASGVKRDACVVDMFAGVGPFTIPVAKRAHKVYAVDINPDAIRYLKENLSLNHIENVEVREGDVRDLSSDLHHLADRVIMNLPLQAFEFLDVAEKIVKRGGVIHYYDIRKEDDLFDGLVEKIKDITGDVEVIERRVVRSYAPHLYNVVIDFVIA